jgi:hypothetical protein
VIEIAFLALVGALAADAAGGRRRPLLFHVTSFEAMESIREHGLRTGDGRTGNFDHNMGHHTRGRVFLGGGLDTALTWFTLIEQSLWDRFQDEAADAVRDGDVDGGLAKVIPVMLRVEDPSVLEHLEHDEEGRRTHAAGSFLTTRPIPPEALSFWDPTARTWRPVGEWGTWVTVSAEAGARWKLAGAGTEDEYVDIDVVGAYEIGGFKPRTADEASTPVRSAAEERTATRRREIARKPKVDDRVDPKDYGGTPYLYHMTRRKNLASIVSRGLHPGNGENATTNETREHSRGRLFLTTQPAKWEAYLPEADVVVLRLETTSVSCAYDGGEWDYDDEPEDEVIPGKLADCYTTAWISPRLLYARLPDGSFVPLHEWWSRHRMDHLRDAVVEELQRNRLRRLPHPTTFLDDGQNAAVFDSDDPDVVVRIGPTQGSHEDVLLELQDTGGVVKVHGLLEIPAERMPEGVARVVTWKERLGHGVQSLLFESYPEQEATEIIVALNSLYHDGTPGRVRRAVALLAKYPETEGLARAIREGLPTNDLSADSNLGVTRDGRIVAYDP